MNCPDMCPDEYCYVNKEGTPWKPNMTCTKFAPTERDQCCRCASNTYAIGECAPGCVDSMSGECKTDGKSYDPKPRPKPVPVRPIPVNPIGKKNNNNGSSPSPKPGKLNAGEIAGIVIGSVAGLALIILLICMLAKKKRR